MDHSLENSVFLAGKISRVTPLKYTPSGVPVCEALLAVPQDSFGKRTIGYYDLIFFGEVAEKEGSQLRIGVSAKIEGSLWSRKYRNRRGTEVTEIKVMVTKVGIQRTNERPKRQIEGTL